MNVTIKKKNDAGSFKNVTKKLLHISFCFTLLKIHYCIFEISTTLMIIQINYVFRTINIKTHLFNNMPY